MRLPVPGWRETYNIHGKSLFTIHRYANTYAHNVRVVSRMNISAGNPSRYARVDKVNPC